MTAKQWVTVSTLAKVLGVSDPTVRRFVKEGRFGPEHEDWYRLAGGQMRVAATAVDRYLDAIDPAMGRTIAIAMAAASAGAQTEPERQAAPVPVRLGLVGKPFGQRPDLDPVLRPPPKWGRRI